MNKVFSLLLPAVLVLAFAMPQQAHAQQICEVSKDQGQGFSTTIQSVVNNCDGEYEIILRVEHDGCPGPTCKELSHYTVEATPGTYSNITVGNVNGDFTYGNINMGPNQGGTPYDGFKVDGTSGLGDGQAGSFTISYTLEGGLQDQQVGAKVGPDYLIKTFTVADFESVINCAGTFCEDDTVINKYPSEDFGTLAFEDLWPAQGDFDFNDVVIDYLFEAESNTSNYVSNIQATFILRAFGAGFRNGFGFQFGNTINASHLQVSGYSLTENFISLNSNGTENGQSNATIIVFDNTYNQMQHPGTGIGVNTDPNAPFVIPDTLRINIEVTPNTYTLDDFNIGGFNPFIIVNRDRTREVHLPGFPPTDLAAMSWFGTSDDASDPSAGKWYVTKNNLPWAIHTSVSFDYPIEKADVNQAHLKMSEWAQSGGALYSDWYLNKTGYRYSPLIYDEN